MKIVGMLGAVIGFIISLLLLSFIICSLIINGGIDEKEKDK